MVLEIDRVVTPVLPEEPPHRSWLAKHWTLYRDARLSDLAPHVLEAYRMARRAGRGLFVYSEYKGPQNTGAGVGKTHALVAMFDALACEWWDRHQQDNGIVLGDDGAVTIDEGPALWQYTDLCEELRRDISRSPDQGPQAYPYFARINPLFIDDIGAGRVTQWVAEKLYTLLNERNNKQRVTYLTSNHNLGALQAVLNECYGPDNTLTTARDGHRIVSRLMEHCVSVKLDGPDRRLS